MADFKKILLDIRDLINRSNGAPIDCGGSRFIFQKIRDVSLDEIVEFEEKYEIKIPTEYKDFLLTVGACSLFHDDILPGVDFLAPNDFYEWAQRVFDGTGSNLFPDILITVSIPGTGEQAGFALTEKDNNFGVFFPDIPPEEWKTDTEFVRFEDWLENLVKENIEGMA